MLSEICCKKMVMRLDEFEQIETIYDKKECEPD
jgi:hypothetical protein